MLDILIALLRALTSTLRTRRDLALCQQLTVAKRHMKRSNLKKEP